MRLPRVLGGPRRGIFGLLLLIALGQAASAVALTRVLRSAVRAAELPAHAGLGPLLVAALLLVPAIAALRWCERLQAERLAQSYLHRLRRTMFEHLTGFDAGTAQRVQRGAILLRFIGDLGSVGAWISGGIARLAVAAVMVGVTLAALAVDDWRLALVVLAVLVVTGLLTRLAGTRLYHAMAQVRRHSARLANDVAERTQALPLVRAFARAEREQRRLARRSDRIRAARIERARRDGVLAALADAAGALLVIAVLGAGVVLLRPDATGIGTLVVAVTFVTLLAAPLRNAARAYDYWCRFRLSRVRIGAFLDQRSRRAVPPARTAAAPATPPAAAAVPLAGAALIEARGLALAGRLVATDLVLGTGERVVVTGAGGAGKSTLLALLAGWLDADSGALRIAGRPAADWPTAERPRLIGVHAADLPLVRGSALRNLLYRCPGASAVDIGRASTLFGLAPLLQVPGRERGRRLTEGGANLSSNERIRLMLARAWIGTPRLLLLDDLDAITDPALRAGLREAIARFEGAVVMVSESAELAALAGTRWHLDAGRVGVHRPAAPAATARPARLQAWAARP
ncbi:MAG: ABC transporter ATP-binding protein [Steroidobacteraceae bacterium]